MPRAGWRKKSLLNTAVAPPKVSANPDQNLAARRPCQNNQAAKATHNGAVLPNRVALAAEVKFTEVFHRAWSMAVMIPPRMGKSSAARGSGPRERRRRRKAG